MAMLNLILLVAAFLCLLAAAVGVSHPRLNLGWFGLALWVLAILTTSKLP